MSRKSQVLLIVLWILIAITVLAVSIGHRVSMALRLGRYQKDSLKALYLAKAGVSLAIIEIDNDVTPNCDTFQDKWADNEDSFREIKLVADTDDFARVSYILEESGTVNTRFGARDEDSRINLNKADEKTLTLLFEECGLDSLKAEELANDILVWRDTSRALDENTKNYYEITLGYPCKRSALSIPEEITLVKGMQGIENVTLKKIKSLATVYGDAKINLNTAAIGVLRTIALKAAQETPVVDEGAALQLARDIITFREGAGYFDSLSTVNTKLNIPAGDPKETIINRLNSVLKINSEYFKIESTGNVGKITRKVSTVYKRGDKKVLFWHEN